ncbi:uncharacterized protein LOC130542121 [Ursus arctos]|uniref:uncharacterized protein LOC130542121 n=1 Tax=Ursus arctos TaxID=9644 RepID=UPI00254690AF|nr:uncharacterized protein LOC130542121 [Ursus arctos]
MVDTVACGWSKLFGVLGVARHSSDPIKSVSLSGETLTRCLHTSALPIPPPFPALSKFGNTFGHVGALCRHRRGHTLQISGQPGSCRRDRSPEIKAGAVQPCLTLCPAGHPQGGGRPAGAAEAREEGAGIRQRGAARGRPPPAPSPRPLTPPAPSFLQLWGVCAPTFSAVSTLHLLFTDALSSSGFTSSTLSLDSDLTLQRVPQCLDLRVHSLTPLLQVTPKHVLGFLRAPLYKLGKMPSPSRGTSNSTLRWGRLLWSHPKQRPHQCGY